MTIIQNTTNYSQFHINSDRNRSIHCKKLLEAIRKKNLLASHPIAVDKYFQVIDGQHRLECAKMLNVPIYYVVCEDASMDDIPLCQTQRPWELKDYMKFYSRDYPDYKFIYDLSMEYDFTIKFILECCTDLIDCSKNFRAGKFTIKKDPVIIKQRFTLVKELIEFYRDLLKKKSFQKNELTALYRLVGKENYQQSFMKEKSISDLDETIIAFKMKKPKDIMNRLIVIFNKNRKIARIPQDKEND